MLVFLCLALTPQGSGPLVAMPMVFQSTSTQAFDWLNASPGKKSSLRPTAKRNRLAEQQSHWLRPSVGVASSYAATSCVQCSELSEDFGATTHARRINLNCVALLMINYTITKQTTYQINVADSGRIHTLLAQ